MTTTAPNTRPSIATRPKRSISPPRTSGSADVLERVRSIPQLRLEASSGAVASVVFHDTPIARIDEDRQTAEVGVPALAVAVGLVSANGVETAVALIREARDEGLYGWQAEASSP